MSSEQPHWAGVVVLSVLVSFLVARFGVEGVEVEGAKYGVVFDAGSTGTRLNVCRFGRIKESKRMKLLWHHYVEVKGGLAFSEDVESLIGPMVDEAKMLVPERCFGNTPVFLRATAGLRLTGEDVASKLLDDVRRVLELSGFFFEPSHVSIMDGEDEGLFAWATVNELLDWEGKIGTIDLGGGSVQLTYPVDDHHPSASSLSIGDRAFRLHSHSHLGYGLVEFKNRLQLSVQNMEPHQNNPCAKSLEDDIVGAGDFDECLQLVLSTFTMRDIHTGEICTSYESDNCTLEGVSRPKPAGRFVAFAYFYDTVVSAAGLSPASSIGDIRTRGILACSNRSDPVPCEDLAYVYALLSHGLNLDNPEVSISFQQRIRGRMIGWAIGSLLLSTENPVGSQTTARTTPT